MGEQLHSLQDDSGFVKAGELSSTQVLQSLFVDHILQGGLHEWTLELGSA